MSHALQSMCSVVRGVVQKHMNNMGQVNGALRVNG